MASAAVTGTPVGTPVSTPTAVPVVAPVVVPAAASAAAAAAATAAVPEATAATRHTIGSFVTIDATAWPFVTLHFEHATPSREERETYFGALAAVLHAATAEAPCALIFDATAVRLLRGVDADFVETHKVFNKAYYAHMERVCSGFGVVVANALLRTIIGGLLALTPPSKPCHHCASVAAAMQKLAPAPPLLPRAT